MLNTETIGFTKTLPMYRLCVLGPFFLYYHKHVLFLIIGVSRLKDNEILDMGACYTTFFISSVKYRKCMLRYDRNVT